MCLIWPTESLSSQHWKTKVHHYYHVLIYCFDKLTKVSPSHLDWKIYPESFPISFHFTLAH